MWMSLDRLESSSHQLGEDMLAHISKMKSEINYTLAALKRDMSEARSDILQEVTSSSRSLDDAPSLDHKTLVALSTMLSSCLNKASDMVVALTILNTLTFEQMRYRQATVLEAHPGTFDWVHRDKFTAWLQSSNPIF